MSDATLSPDRRVGITYEADDTPQGLRETWPLRRRQALLLLAGYVVLTAVWVAIGELLTGPLGDSAIVDGDRRAVEWFADRRTPTRDRLSTVGSMLSDTFVKIIATAVLALLMLKLFKRWLEPLVLAVSLILEAWVFITVTKIVGRPRPDVPRLEESPVGSSFPSGHVAAATVYAALAVIVFWHTRKLWARIAIVAVTAAIPPIVAVARIYRGMHFPSDMVAGALLGAASLVVTLVVLTRSPQGRAALRNEDEPSP